MKVCLRAQHDVVPAKHWRLRNSNRQACQGGRRRMHCLCRKACSVASRFITAHIVLRNSQANCAHLGTRVLVVVGDGVRGLIAVQVLLVVHQSCSERVPHRQLIKTHQEHQRRGMLPSQISFKVGQRWLHTLHFSKALRQRYPVCLLPLRPISIVHTRGAIGTCWKVEVHMDHNILAA